MRNVSNQNTRFLIRNWFIPGGVGLAFQKMLLPEYQISKTVLFYSRCVLIKLSNSLSYNGQAIPSSPYVRVSTESPFHKLLKGVKTTSKLSLCFLPDNNDTYINSCILPSWENGIPLKGLFIPWAAMHRVCSLKIKVCYLNNAGFLC